MTSWPVRKSPGDVVEVAEVGEVACVGDGDGVVFRGEEMDEFGWSCRLLAVDGGDHVRGAFEGVKRQAVEEKGQASAFGVQGGDGGIGAIAAGDALPEGGDDSLFGEAGEGGGLVEVDDDGVLAAGGVSGVVGACEGEGAEVDEAADLGVCGG